ncbi:MAG: hypothetical protein AVDCRST_MAG13-3024, partial [uncultured Solirubrobacteraceae bacterium]
GGHEGRLLSLRDLQAVRQGPRAPAHRGRAARPRRRGRRAVAPGAAGRLAGLLHGDHHGDVRPAQGVGHRGRRGRGPVPPRRPRLPDPLRARHALPRHALLRAGRPPEGHRGQVPRAPHARRRGHVRRACRAGLPRPL